MATGIQHKGLLSIIAFAAIIFGASTLFTTPAAADCLGISTSIIDCSGSNDTTGSPVVGVLVVAIQLLTAVIGIVGIGVIIYAGILYSSASGNISQTTKAKELIFNTLIAMALFAALVAFMNWLIPGGVFSGNAKFGAGGNGQGSVTAKLLQVPKAPSADNDDETPASADNNSASSTKLVIGSWNIYKNGKTSNAVKGIQTLVKEVDVLGIQESQADVPEIAKGVKSSGYSVYPTNKKDPRKVAILWNNKKFGVVSKGHFYGGYQPAYGLQREFVWIKLKEKSSGKVFYVINTHFPHNGNYKKGSTWYISDNSNGRAYETHMKKLVAKVKSLQKEGLPIFLTGDYNFNYRADNCKQTYTPCKALSKGLNVKSGWEWTNYSSSTGSIKSSSALIDYVMSWQRPNVTYQSMRVLHGGSGFGWSGSDHKPIGLRLTIGAQQ